jgi:L-lysine 2,3-aminomutase
MEDASGCGDCLKCTFDLNAMSMLNIVAFESLYHSGVKLTNKMVLMKYIQQTLHYQGQLYHAF